MLIWIDGFEGLKTSGALTTALLARRYASSTQATNMSIVAGRVAGYALYVNAAGTGYIQTPVLTTDATLVVGLAYKPTTSYPSSSTTLIALYDGATLGMNVKLTSGGALAVYLGASLIDTTPAFSLTLEQWVYIEFKVVCNASGSYELRVDNINRLSDSSLNTKAGANNYHDQIQIANPRYSYFDDFYICDGSGSLNNTFLGPCRTLASNPTNDSTVNWSTVYPALTDHYADVDDGAVADDDTTYVEDNTTGHRDIFDYADVTILTCILGVSINTTCKVTDVNAVDLKTVIKSSVNESVSSSDPISSTSYLTRSYISETDPDTSAAWDVANLNTATIGFEVG